ncbi:hypothetical protein ACVIHH_008377 [Bradyrhizobium sp. USDA 4518]
MRHRPKLDHAASADGAQVEALTKEDGAALTIVDSFGRRRWLRRLKRRSDARKFGGAAVFAAMMTDARRNLFGNSGAESDE